MEYQRSVWEVDEKNICEQRGFKEFDSLLFCHSMAVVALGMGNEWCLGNGKVGLHFSLLNSCKIRVKMNWVLPFDDHSSLLTLGVHLYTAADWSFLISFQFPQNFYYKTPHTHAILFTSIVELFFISHLYIRIQWLLLLQIFHQSCSCSLFCLVPLWLLLLVTCTKIWISLGVMAEPRSSTMDSFSLSPLTKPLALASSPRMNICLGRLICSWSLCLVTLLAQSLPTM